MFGDKKEMRLKALMAMGKDKPMIAVKKSPLDMGGEAEGKEPGEEGMTSMPVTMEEKEMILAMRKKMGGDMGEEEMGEEAGEGEMA